jgi:transcriptional regulator with XRE-family HTH domain
MFMTAMGDYIQERRRTLGLKQYELADRVKRSASLVSEWEKGSQDVPLELIEPLAEALEENSPLTLYQLAGRLHNLPGSEIVRLVEDLPIEQLRVLENMVRAFVEGQKKR